LSTNGNTQTVEAAINLNRIKRESITVPILGLSPLIVNQFPEKAKQQMLDAQQGRKAKVRAFKDPAADFQNAKYLLEDGRDAFPAVGFKAAIVGAARLFDKAITMTALRSMIYVVGEGPNQLVPLSYSEVTMRDDIVRVGQGTADLRYRPQYNDWGAVIEISYVPSAISQESVIALVDAAGIGGIGEWRPSKAATGSYGTFAVADL
jgi:hypothetical protein